MSDNLPAVAGSLDAAENKLALMATDNLGVWSSIKGDTIEGKMDTFDALSNAVNIDDAGMLDTPFILTNIIMQAVSVVDENGEDRPSIRALLVAEDGATYAATSDGLFNGLKNLIGVVGSPDVWPNHKLPVIVKRVRGRRGFFFYTLSLYRGEFPKK